MSLWAAPQVVDAWLEAVRQLAPHLERGVLLGKVVGLAIAKIGAPQSSVRARWTAAALLGAAAPFLLREDLEGTVLAKVLALCQVRCTGKTVLANVLLAVVAAMCQVRWQKCTGKSDGTVPYVVAKVSLAKPTALWQVRWQKCIGKSGCARCAVLAKAQWQEYWRCARCAGNSVWAKVSAWCKVCWQNCTGKNILAKVMAIC